MKQVPSYGKIINLGSAGTENALIGEVVLQEKVDGSQFGFGVNDDGELVFRSKGQHLDLNNPNKMFKKGVDYLLSIEHKLSALTPDTYVYAEYLQKPKHNTLAYDRIPQNHIVIFDIITGGKFADRELLETIAKLLEVDVIPQYKVGNLTTDDIKSFMDKESYLGGQKIEGVVIKNYEQWVHYNGKDIPLFTKYVSEEFKEKHKKNPEYKPANKSVTYYLLTYKNENRWQKAVQHAEEEGILTGEPRDIGKLIPKIVEDVITEEKENIKNDLYNMFEKDLKRICVAGFPEWYKKQLLEKAFGDNNEK